LFVLKTWPLVYVILVENLTGLYLENDRSVLFASWTHS